MNHQKRQTVFWVALTSTLIGILLLAGSPLPAGAGPELPPREPPPPAQPSGDEDDQPAGAHIVLHVPSAPAGVSNTPSAQPQNDMLGGLYVSFAAEIQAPGKSVR